MIIMVIIGVVMMMMVVMMVAMMIVIRMIPVLLNLQTNRPQSLEALPDQSKAKSRRSSVPGISTQSYQESQVPVPGT